MPTRVMKLIRQKCTHIHYKPHKEPQKIFTNQSLKHEAVYCTFCTCCLRNGRGRSEPGGESWVLPEGTILQRRHIPVLPGTREL